MDEELEQEGQENNRGRGGFNNPIKNVEDKANSVKDYADRSSKRHQNKAKKKENKANKLNQQSKNQAGKAAEKSTKKATRATKKATKHTKKAEKMAKVASKAGKVANAASKLATIMSTVGLVLIIIIAIIGVLVFILTGLGLIMQGLEQIVTSIWNAIQSMAEGQENIVGEKEIIDTADYLEQMGYDLYGYGFTTKDDAILSADEYAKKELGEEEYERLKKKAGEGDEEAKEEIESAKPETDPALAYEDDKEVYKYLTAYLISDNYAYTVKNSNKNFVKAFSSPGTFLSGLTDAAGWGTGLISLYHQEGDDNEITGKPGDAYGLSGADLAAGGLGAAMLATPAAPVGALILTIDAVLNWEDLTSSIKIENNENNKPMLTVNGPGLFNTAIMKYSLDGWTGRYSMPLEFLLATHLATMAPDLSYKMATSFNTDVEIILFESDDAKAIAGIRNGGEGSTVIELKEFEEINDALFSGWDWASVQSLSKSEALEIMKKTGIKSYEGDNDKYHCYGPEGTEDISTDDSHWATVTKEEWNKFVENKELTGGLNELENGQNGAKSRIKELFESQEGDYTFDDNTTLDELYKNLTISGGGVEPKKWIVEDDLDEEKKINCTGSMIVTAKDSEGKEVKLRFSSQYRNHNVTRQESKVEQISGNVTYETVLNYREADFWISVTQINQTDGVKCSDENNTATEACDACHEYIKLIYKALREVNDNGFDTYVPYINSVTNHWYRNVYFTEAAIEDGDKIVKTDAEYEKQTGERWTLYEMNEEDPSQYELYVYLKGNDGEYKTELEESTVCVKVGEDEKGDYKLSDDGVTYKKDSNGNYKLQTVTVDNNNKKNYKKYNGSPEEFRVGKKAVTQKINTGWIAYGSEPKKKDEGWKEVTPSEDSPESIVEFYDLNSDLPKELKSELVYQLDMYEVEQVEDGIRGETNATIKKLFLDDYYIFDGTGSTAALIQKAKKLVNDEDDSLDKDDPDSFKELFDENKKIKVQYDGKYYTTTIDKISGPISLTHSSLSAFSILENMHTLDAEYIYHDFKELIVELNYFDKEDLVEGEDEVLMFPVSGISAAGWPVARYDKSEDFYGTLIHSAEDYKARRKETEAELAMTLVGEYDADSTLNDSNVSSNPSNSSTDESGNTTYSDNIFLQAAEDIHKYMEDNNYTYCVFNNNSYEECSGGEAHGLENTFKKSQNGKHHTCCATYVMWVCKAIGIKDITSNAANELKDQANASEYFEVKDYSRNDLQAGDIVWRDHHVQIFAGFDSSNNMTWYNAGSGDSIRKDSPYTSDSNSWGKIIRIKKWDGLKYNGVSGGSSSSSETVEFEGYAGSEEGADEYVVSPATGEVLKYGTVERTNIETGKKQDVGFIKIRLLGTKETDILKNAVSTKFGRKSSDPNYGNFLRNDDSEGWLEDKYTESDLKKVGYDYFWSEYKDAGISDNIVYLEGFDVTEVLGVDKTKDVDKNKNNGQNITKLKRYIEKDDTPNSYGTQYTVPNLLDDTKEFELKVGEAAKEKAAYTLKVGNKIYIKEGAVIGKTYSSDDETITEREKITVIDQDAQEENETDEDSSVATTRKKFNIGNYMRMILRDTKDEVVENVEEYVEIPEEGTSAGIDTDFPEEFLYWEAVYVEGGIEREGNYYKRQDLDDGKMTTAFGLTEDCEGTAGELGYNDYKQCLINGRVPVKMAQDVFVGEMEADREAILNGTSEDKLSESGLDALVSIYHNAPARAQNLLDKLNSNGSLTEQNFIDEWGTTTVYEAALKKRRRGEFKLYNEGKYVDYKR